MEPGLWTKSAAFQLGRSNHLISRGMLRFNDSVFFSAFDEICTAASTKQHMLVPLCLCTLNVYMCKSGHVFLSLHEYI